MNFIQNFVVSGKIMSGKNIALEALFLYFDNQAAIGSNHQSVLVDVGGSEGSEGQKHRKIISCYHPVMLGYIICHLWYHTRP